MSDSEQTVFDMTGVTTSEVPAWKYWTSQLKPGLFCLTDAGMTCAEQQ